MSSVSNKPGVNQVTPGTLQLGELLSEQFASDRAARRRRLIKGAVAAFCVGVIGLQFVT